MVFGCDIKFYVQSQENFIKRSFCYNYKKWQTSPNNIWQLNYWGNFILNDFLKKKEINPSFLFSYILRRIFKKYLHHFILCKHFVKHIFRSLLLSFYYFLIKKLKTMQLNNLSLEIKYPFLYIYFYASFLYRCWLSQSVRLFTDCIFLHI